jgi:hypothetical protein
MNFKHRLYLVFIFIFGVIVGKIDKPSIKEEKVITFKESIENKEKMEQIELNVVKNQNKIERYYLDGKISKEIILENSNINLSKINIKENTNKIEQAYSETTKKLYSNNNWIVGSFIPYEAIKDKKYQDLTIQIGYRIIGNVYVTAGSDIEFKNPSLGVQFTF